MAVRPEPTGLVSRRSQSLVQRSVDTVSELADMTAAKLSSLSDPRSRLLRKRRWALRLGLLFSSATAFWVGLTGLLAAWSTPVWALIVTGAIAAGAAVPGTLFLLRYRWLRGEILPPQRQVSGRRLPPPGSVVRPAMSALAASERGLHSLLGVLERGKMLPADEIRELTLAAGHSASTMAATAAEVVSMERAAAQAPDSRGYLAPTINALTAQLTSGVRQYNDMVTAAAQLVASVNAGVSGQVSEQRYRGELAGELARELARELANATDRLLGWAAAFEELGPVR